MTSATHSVPVNTCLVDLVLLFGRLSYTLAATPVMEFAAGSGAPFQMLLGRDVICQGSFNMTFDGHFTFCI